MSERFRQAGPLVFAAGVLAIVAAIVAVTSERSWRRVGYNGVATQLAIGLLPAGAVGCQPHEPLPTGTRAVQIHAVPAGPGRLDVRVELREAGRHTGVGSGASAVAGGTIVAPLAHPLKRDVVAPLCIHNTGAAPLALEGAATGPADQLTVSTPGKPLENLLGRVRIDDLNSARPSSLWPMLSRLPERFAAATGSALAPWLVLVGLLGALPLTAVLLWRPKTGARHGRELLLVGLVSVLMGACWAGITPAFEKTDETAHFAYVQAFAELGHPPTQFADTGLLSGSLTCWYNGLDVIRYRFYTGERPPWSSENRHLLDRTCAKLPSGYNGAMYMAFQPPAYYALDAGAYELASGFALPTQILFARMVSVLLAAFAVAMTYLLVRELIPGSPWPARVGALSLALQPVFMFNESGVNPDALMLAIASAIALLGARAWRRGLTTGRALGLGALTGVGVLSKTNFLALLPSILLLAAALWWGSPSGTRRVRGLRLAGGAALAGLIFAAYALINNLAWHRGLRYRDETFGGAGGSLHRLLEFTWEFFLPRFGTIRNLVGTPGIPFVELIESSTTRLGWWNDYGIAGGWTPLLMASGVLLAIGAAVYVVPRARRRPAPLLVALGCAVLFLAALVWAGYQFSLGTGADVIIPRHALAAMPLWGLLVGCAVAAARPRWRPALAGLLAAVFLAHSAVALTTTIQRFYL